MSFPYFRQIFSHFHCLRYAAVRTFNSESISNISPRGGKFEGDGGLEELSRSVEEKDLNIPGLNGKLRGYQLAGVRYAIVSRRCFIADEMGTGKTVQALATIEASNAYPALIVTPLVTKTHWQRHIESWLPNRSIRILKGRCDNPEAERRLSRVGIESMKNKELSRELKERGLPGSGKKEILRQRLIHYLETHQEEEGEEEDLVVTHYDILDTWSPSLVGRFRSVVFDEAHYIRNKKTNRGKAAKAISDGIRALDDGIILLLTGTPVVNRPSDLVHQLQVLGRLTQFGGWMKFVRRYCQAYKSRFGWVTDGASNLDELHHILRDSCYIRRTKEQVLKSLPSHTWVDLSIGEEAMESKLVEDYKLARKSVIAYLREESKRAQDLSLETGEDPDEIMKAQAAEHLVRIQVLRQMANQIKLEPVLKWIEDFLDTGEKLIIFAHHRNVMSSIKERFSSAVMIHGGIQYDEKILGVDSFEDDKANLIVCSIRGASVGVELTSACNVLFFEQDWSPAVMDQAAARAHRSGQKRAVTSWVALAEGTIDVDIARTLTRKRKVLKEVTDGGSEYREVRDIGADIGDLVKTLLASEDVLPSSALEFTSTPSNLHSSEPSKPN